MTLWAAPPYPMEAAENRLSDEAVLLAPSNNSDVETVMQWDADREIQHFYDWPLTPPWDDPATYAARRASAGHTIRNHADGWAKGEQFTFVIRWRETGQSVGWLDLQPRGSGRGNVAYGVVAAHRRQGVATRSVVMATRYAFEVLDWVRLELTAIADNVASRRVAVKAGFELEGVLKSYGAYERYQPLLGQRFDWAIYAKLRPDVRP